MGFSAMDDDQQRGGDRGTVLEPIGRLREDRGGTAAEPSRGTLVEPRPTGPDLPTPESIEDGFRPLIRPLVPRLTLLDDGEQVAGETIRLREAVTMIGRTEGQIRLPHDPLVSARHAEVVREGSARPHRWVLRDLGSSNGTFVRCARTILRPESLVMLGRRRFRFRSPEVAAAESLRADATISIDMSTARSPGRAMLVETGQTASPLEIPLDASGLVIGRTGAGNAVEIDDPLLASRHARVVSDAAGRWLLEALPSLNGVWVQVTAVHLATTCRFQTGEQRFLFVVEEG